MTAQILLSQARAALAAPVFLLAASLAMPAAAQQPGAMPPAPVGIVTTEPADLPVTNELPGRIAPTRIAEVRPRVNGIIVERVFTQGSMVKEGDVLYRIDPAPFKVQVDSARATLQRAEAVQLQARQNEERQRDLRDRNVSSAVTFESAVAALAQADADVASARANLAGAELNLQYSEVKAPISGRIGRANITEGALVSSNMTESLAIIQQLDPVYADFTQSASQLLQLRRALKLGALTSANPGEARVRLLLDDGMPYEHPGRLLFSEATVDATTGQVIMRGEFPNPDGNLLPGMYVRVLIEQGILNNAIAIPQQAVQRDATGAAQVYVVKADNTVELRGIVTGRASGNQWIVQQGLKPGEKVVVEGFQKLRPGAAVNAQPWKPVTGPAPAAKSDDAAAAKTQ
jgi:membrane fusion protein (multidrug efflux system)